MRAMNEKKYLPLNCQVPEEMAARKATSGNLSHLCLVFLFALLLSCTSVRVNYDYDTATDFTNYTTYNYYPDMDTGLNQLDAKRLMMAVDSAMQAKGLLLSEEPDFFVNIQSTAYRAPQGSSVGVGVGGSGRSVGGGVSIGLPLGQSNFEREIVFDLVDSQKDALIWQAVSSSNYRDNGAPSTREKQLREVVRKVFSKYPPYIRH